MSDKDYEILDIVGASDDKDLQTYGSSRYSDDYKLKVFQIWYNKGKPSSKILLDLIPFPETNYGRKPSNYTINLWLQDFREQADDLDASVVEKLNNSLIQSKIEMLERHAEVAKEAQQIAMDYIRNNPLTAASAVRLLADSLDRERISRGIPEALSKMVEMTDDQLFDEIRKVVQDADFERIEPNE